MLATAPSGGDTFTGVSGFVYSALAGVSAEIGPSDVRIALQRNWTEIPYPVSAAGAGVVQDGVTNSYSALLAYVSTLGTAMARLAITGTLIVGSSITLPSNLQLDFTGGGRIKPGANATVTINGPINAGAWQIFDISNSNALIRGTPQNAYCYDEWFGAKADNTTDCTIPFNANRAFAHAAGDMPINQLPGNYKITGTVYGIGSSGQSPTAPSCYGAGKKLTVWNYPTVATGLKFVGGSGLPQACVYTGISFVGDASSTAVMFAGVCGFKLIRCMFDANAIGVQWHNEAAGSFTEYCTAESCEWRASCLIDGDFKVTSGNNSFNGSGINGRGLINASATGPVVRVGSGANVYNAPFDAQVWATGGSITIFQNNNASAPVPAGFAGEFTLETTTSVTTTLGSSHSVYFAGPVQVNGLTTTTGANVVAGTFLRVKTMQIHADSSYSFTGAEAGRRVTVTVPTASMAGLNLGVGNMSNVARIADISLSATNYKTRQLVSGDYFGDGTTAAGGGIIAQTANFNSPGGTLGYQAVTNYTGSGNGSLNMTVPTVAKVAGAAFTGGETTTSLSLSWQSPTGTYNWQFSNGDVRAVSCTQGSTTGFTWTGGLSSAATTAITCQTMPNGLTLLADIYETQQSDGIEGSGHMQF